MQLKILPAHDLVAPDEIASGEELIWLTGEPCAEDESGECWYLTFESGPLVIGVRIESQAE